MREQDRDRQKAEWEMKERMASEAKQRNDMQMKHDVEEMQNRIKRTDEELHRRQQENNVFMQVCKMIERFESVISETTMLIVSFSLPSKTSKWVVVQWTTMMTTGGRLRST